MLVCGLKNILETIVEPSFKKCCIINPFDGIEDNFVWKIIDFLDPE